MQAAIGVVESRGKNSTTNRTTLLPVAGDSGQRAAVIALPRQALHRAARRIHPVPPPAAARPIRLPPPASVRRQPERATAASPPRAAPGAPRRTPFRDPGGGARRVAGPERRPPGPRRG